MTQQGVKKVAVIGAGISGVSTAAHLLKQGGSGLEVVLFERSGVAGGVWHFDERSAVDPAYPNERPSKGDYETRPELAYSTPPPEDENEENGKVKDFEIFHAPPGPCYAGLMNNVSTRLMRTSLQAWPEGTADFVSQKILEEYIQALAQDHGVSAITQYHTRVEEVRKHGAHWLVRTTTFHEPNKAASPGSPRLVERHSLFDAVVVASGHYNMPRIPDIPGLKEWKHARPDRVWHSKRYRNPRVFRGHNILLVGAGVSSNDIARESAPYAKHIFQSSRGGVLDLPASFLPENATRVGGIKSFELDDHAIPGKVVLENGDHLSDIDSVILCTGYITSYPFLNHLHDDTIPADKGDDFVLVTAEGDMVHNLHRDMFYIPDPSLIFVGAPYHIATFSLFDFQAEVAARVLSGKASLPSRGQMRDEYRTRVQTKGLGRDFHSLRGEGDEEAYVADLVRWMNEDAGVVVGGGFGSPENIINNRMIGHTTEWHLANRDREEKLKWLRATKNKEKSQAVIGT